jgi:hypothetical protein
MLVLTQRREPSINGATLSKLYIGSEFICDIIEDEVREIPGQSVAQWKKFGVTAIPSGRYRIGLQNSSRFGPDTLTVFDVPGFEGVRIHAGNTAANTEGCLLPGVRNSNCTVGNSRDALAKLRARLAPFYATGVSLEILPAK